MELLQNLPLTTWEWTAPYQRTSSFLTKQITPIITSIISELKILDRYIINQYLTRLASVFAICMPIFVVQVLWLYIDELAGKGLDFETIEKLCTGQTGQASFSRRPATGEKRRIEHAAEVIDLTSD